MRNITPYNAATAPTVGDLFAMYAEPPRNTLGGLQQSIEAATSDFRNAIPNLHTLKTVIASKADRATLVTAYEQRPTAVRMALDALKASLASRDRGLCPFCNLGEDCELDHYLAKSKFPEFSLFSENLVPICPKCNKHKGTSIKNKKGQRLILYPFAELRNAPVFLRAEVDILPVPRVKFEVFNSGLLTQDVFELLIRHFDRLHLNERLSRRARNSLVSLVNNLRGKSEHTIRSTVISSSRTMALTMPTNSWETAMFRALVAGIDNVVDALASP